MPQKIPAKTKKHFTSVIDLGNHWVKFHLDGYELIREPSWFVKCESMSGKIPGHVKYLSGSREDLIDKCWLIGQQAVRVNGSSLIRLVEDYSGKGNLWLEFFLGTLAHLPAINSEMCISITVTCNDVARHQEVILSNQGCHKVELAGLPCSVIIKINKVVPEGISSLKHHNLNGTVTVCDIGGGNITISNFFGQELIKEPEVKDYGVEVLIDAIAKDSRFKALINAPPNKHLINTSIESGIKLKGKEPQLFYGDSHINFYEIYQVKLQEFINQRLREVIRRLEECKLGGDQILITGGGSKLPLLSAALKKKGFLISDNGSFDNIKGLIGG